MGAQAHCQTLMPGGRENRIVPAGAFDYHARPGFGHAHPFQSVCTQHVCEDGDSVITLEGDEGGSFGQPLSQGRRDSCTEWC
jgi:hypothetical protein